MNADTLIIFDCDGVLVDSEPIANQVLADWLTAAGLPTTREDAMARYKGLSMPSVLAKAEEALGAPLPEDFLGSVQAETFERFRAQLKPVDGARDLIGWVQAQGYQSCIASSGGFDKMDVTLSITGLKPLFQGRIFSAMDVQRGKPAPDLFLHASASMGVAPDKCHVIEDSGAGVAAAKAARMHVFAYGAFEKEAGVTPVKHLSEVAGLLTRSV